MPDDSSPLADSCDGREVLNAGRIADQVKRLIEIQAEAKSAYDAITPLDRFNPGLRAQAIVFKEIFRGIGNLLFDAGIEAVPTAAGEPRRRDG